MADSFQGSPSELERAFEGLETLLMACDVAALVVEGETVLEANVEAAKLFRTPRQALLGRTLAQLGVEGEGLLASSAVLVGDCTKARELSLGEEPVELDERMLWWKGRPARLLRFRCRKAHSQTEPTATRSKLRPLPMPEPGSAHAIALSESEDRFNQLAAQSRTVVWEIDPDGVYVYVSEVSALVFGYTPEELEGRMRIYYLPWESKAPFLLQPAHGLALLAALAKQQPFRNIEGRAIRKDGRPIWISTNALPVLDDDGTLLGYRGSHTDISERKLAEQTINDYETLLLCVSEMTTRFIQASDWQSSLAQSLPKLGNAARASRVYLFRVMAEGEEVFASQIEEWCAEGIEPQLDNPELQNLPIRAAGFGRWLDILKQRHQICGALSELPASEQAMLAEQGIVSLLVTPVFSGSQWWGFLGFDECRGQRQWSIPEQHALSLVGDTLGASIARQEAEATLRESEERLRGIIESQHDLVVRFTPDSRMTFTNDACCRSFGKSREQMLRSSPRELVHAQDLDMVIEQFQDLRKPSHRAYVEARAETVGGLRWFAWEAYAICSSQGETIEIQAIGRDITSRKQAELALSVARNREIDIGSRIQNSLLNGRIPNNLKSLDLAASTIPSQRIDGDFFDVFPHSSTVVDLVLGDVMGKGVNAALVAAATKSELLRIFASRPRTDCSRLLDLPTIVGSLDYALTTHLIAIDSFITLAFARFDLSRRQLSLVDCGHTPVLQLREDGSVQMLKGSSLPLGVIPDERYDAEVYDFAEGDVFLFFSDGVTEASSPEEELFGEERLAALAAAHVRESAETIINAIYRGVVDFVGSTQLRDDFTCLCVRIASSSRVRSLMLKSSFEHLEQVRSFVREACAAELLSRISEETLQRLELAVDEAFTNVVRHAYYGDQTRDIELRIESLGDAMVIELHHCGERFDPSIVQEPSFDGSRDGGFGIHLMRQCVDELSYLVSDEGRCVVRLYKRFE
ncbi:MAG: SpoIIE family protein phosphatase [Myxococcota bacterium]|nr:SpoIIE family protein phosphatase [Myxococcota bacterium]